MLLQHILRESLKNALVPPMPSAVCDCIPCPGNSVVHHAINHTAKSKGTGFKQRKNSHIVWEETVML